MDKIKEWFRKIDWWETAYLMIYGIVLAKEFLQTMMFPIPWPLGLGYILAGLSGGYVIAKFLFHNTYTKKETILAVLSLIAFWVPALTTDYTFLFWTGCMIVGAKGVDFNKILKLYLVMGITIMVVGFGASQLGLIENLQILSPRGDEVYARYSYGAIYPTDYAAHWFFIVLAGAVLMERQVKTWIVVWVSMLTGICVYMTSNAQTTLLCLFGFSGLCIVERILHKQMPIIEKLFRWIPVACATLFITLTYTFDPTKGWMSKLDTLLSFRLKISKLGADTYPITLFGQDIVEVGLGCSLTGKENYFFLDDSYIRILLKYGLALLVITLVLSVLLSKKASEEGRYVLVMALVAIAVHSFMENRLIDIAYNPMMIAMFATLAPKEQLNDNYRKREI